MIAVLIDDFSESEACRKAWTDHIWKRRAEAEHILNQARAAAFEARKALLLECDLPEHMRAHAPARRRMPLPKITAADVRRVLRAA